MSQEASGGGEEAAAAILHQSVRVVRISVPLGPSLQGTSKASVALSLSQVAVQ